MRSKLSKKLARLQSSTGINQGIVRPPLFKPNGHAGLPFWANHKVRAFMFEGTRFTSAAIIRGGLMWQWPIAYLCKGQTVVEGAAVLHRTIKGAGYA